MHHKLQEPSHWVQRFSSLLPHRGHVLDLAAGGGRHGRFLLDCGHRVTFVDLHTEDLIDLSTLPDTTIIQADLENGSEWPLQETYSGIIVINYLYRPILEKIIDALETGGILIYETFARGNEVFNRPRNPDHLLKSGELLELVSEKMQVIAYEHGNLDLSTKPCVVQRICASKNLRLSKREDREPPHFSLNIK